MNKIFTWAPKFMSKIAMHTNWIGQSSRTNCMFHILEEVGAELKMSISWPIMVEWKKQVRVNLNSYIAHT